MTVIRLSPDDPSWMRWLASRPDATPFHHPAWSRVVAGTYGYPSFVLAVSDDKHGVRGGVPVVDVSRPLLGRRWVSLPFTDWCPPLTDESVLPGELAADLDAARRDAGVSQFEIRAGFTSISESVAVGLRHVLPLTAGPDILFAAFHPSQVQRNIRRAEREKVRILHSTSSADLLGPFYDLHLQTRRRLGVPVQPRGFFRLIADEILARDLGFLLLASHGDRIVAAALFLAWNGTIVYKFGASQAEAWPVRPNHAIFWEAIQWGCARGFHTLDFGRTDFDTPGLRAFKLHWGSEEQTLVYGALGKPLRSGGGRGRAAHVLGPVIRHAPAWVAQAAGELLYRFAA